MSPAEKLALAATVIGLLSVLGGWIRWGRPHMAKAKRDATAMRDAILGRDPVVDTITGKELAPPLPGIGVRMANQEQQMEAITAAVTRIASQHEALTDHEHRIKALEEAAVERVVSRVESAQAWSAIEAAINADPNEDAETEL